MLVEIRMAEHPDKHGGHTVQGSAFVPTDRGESGTCIEGFAGEDHGRAYRGAGQHPEHHAEAMVEGHGNTEPVGWTQRHRLGAVARVVDDIEMTESCAFRQP